MLERLGAENDVHGLGADGPRVAFEVHPVWNLVPEVALGVGRIDAQVASGGSEERSIRLRAAADIEHDAIDAREFPVRSLQILPAWRSISRRNAANMRRTRVFGGEGAGDASSPCVP